MGPLQPLRNGWMGVGPGERKGFVRLAMFDRLAASLYREARCSMHRPSCAVILERLIGAECVRFEGMEVNVFCASGRYWVTLPCGLSCPDLTAAIATALAKLVSMRIGVPFNVTETVDLAGAIAMPQPALEQLVAQTGVDVDGVAEAFAVPRAWADHRLRTAGWTDSSDTFMMPLRLRRLA